MSSDAAHAEAYGNGSSGNDSPMKEHANGSAPITTDHLYHALTTTSTISPEAFERLYLSPQNRVSGDLRKTFANPTPLALLGFATGLTPLSIEFMGWRGSGGNAIATGTASLWFGGVCLYVAGILEFFLGNTFPFIVFFGYGSHFLTFATTWMPFFNAVGYFNKTGATTEAAGLQPIFLASYAFYPVSMAILSFVFLICSFRTNLVFVFIFMFATTGFGCAAGAFFHLAQGATVLGDKLVVGTGACFFGAAVLGWYLLMSVMFQIMELPIPVLPVFDLSTVIKAKKPKVQ